MFLLGHGMFAFLSKSWLWSCKSPWRKIRGSSNASVGFYKKKRKEKKDNNLCGWLKSILITNEQGKNKPLEQAGMWPGDLRRKPGRGYPSACHLGPLPPFPTPFVEPTYTQGLCAGSRDLCGPTPMGKHSPPTHFKVGVSGKA